MFIYLNLIFAAVDGIQCRWPQRGDHGTDLVLSVVKPLLMDDLLKINSSSSDSFDFNFDEIGELKGRLTARTSFATLVFHVC